MVLYASAATRRTVSVERSLMRLTDAYRETRSPRSSNGLWVEAAFLVFTFFVIVPSIAAAIGYAAWKGKPKNFDREMYWTAFACVSMSRS